MQWSEEELKAFFWAGVEYAQAGILNQMDKTYKGFEIDFPEYLQSVLSTKQKHDQCTIPEQTT